MKKLKLKRSSIFAFRRSLNKSDNEKKKGKANELVKLKNQTAEQLVHDFNDTFAELRKKKNKELADKDDQIEQLKADLQAQCDVSALSNEINSRKNRRSSEGLIKIKRFSLEPELHPLNEDHAMQTNEDVDLQLDKVKIDHQTKEIERLKKVILENYKELEKNDQTIEDLKKENGEKQMKYVKQIQAEKRQIEELKKGISAQNDKMANTKKLADGIIKKRDLQIDSLSMQLQEKNEEIGRNMGLLEEKDGKIFDLTQANVAIANERDTDKSEIERLRNLISGQEKEMNDLQRKYAAQRAEEREKISDLARLHEMERNATKEIIKRCEDEIESSKNKNEIDQKLLKEQIEANEKEIDRLQNEIDESNKGIEKENAEITKLKEHNAENEEDKILIDQLKNDLSDYNEVKQRLVEREAEIADFKKNYVFKQIAQREKELEEVMRKYSEIENKANEQEAEIERLRNENEENKAILNEKQSFEESVQKYNEELMIKYKSKLEKKEAKIADLKQKNNAIRRSSMMNQATIENLWVEMGQKVQERDNLLETLEQREGKIEKLKKKTKKLEKEKQAFKGGLGSVHVTTRPFKTSENCDLYLNKLVKKVQGMKGFMGGIWTKQRTAPGHNKPAQIEFSFSYLAEDIMHYPGVIQLTSLLKRDKKNVQNVKIEDQKYL